MRINKQLLLRQIKWFRVTKNFSVKNVEATFDDPCKKRNKVMKTDFQLAVA